MSKAKQARDDIDSRIQNMLLGHLLAKPEDLSVVGQWYKKEQETIIAEVNKELEQYYMQWRPGNFTEDRWYCFYFGNFHKYLPGNQFRLTSSGRYHELIQESRGHVLAQVVMDVDWLIQVCKLDLQQIKKQSQHIDRLPKPNYRNLRTLLELTLPVFIGLQIQQYPSDEMRLENTALLE